MTTLDPQNCPMPSLTLRKYGDMIDNPPELVLHLASLVLIAMTLRAHKTDVVRAYEAKILAELDADPAPRFADSLPSGMKILDPKHAYLLSEGDSTIFLRRCEEERIKANLHVDVEGGCPALEAERILLEAKVALAQAVEPYTGLLAEELRTYPPALDAIVDLTLTGVADRVRPQQLLAEMCGVADPSGDAHGSPR